jgi:glycosyltransferase involved in cell wall biosynthesis
VIVDDGSTDRTRALAEERAILDARVEVLSIPNGGVSNARMVGLGCATGRYVLFLDSDDIAAQGMLRELTIAADQDDCDIVQCSLVRFGQGSERIVTAPAFRGLAVGDLGPHLPYLVSTSLLHHLGNKLFRLETIRRTKADFPSSMSIGEDLMFVLAVMEGSQKVTSLPYGLYRYRLHGTDTLSVRFHQGGIEAYMVHRRALAELYRRCGVAERGRKALDDRLVFDLYHHLSQAYLRHGKVRAAQELERIRHGFPREWAIACSQRMSSPRAALVCSGCLGLLAAVYRAEMALKRRFRP